MVLAALGAPALLLVSAPPVAAADAGESIGSYDVSLKVGLDGTLHVREQISYDFGTNDKHGIIRTIPTTLHYDDTYDRIYRLDHISVSSPTGAPTRTEIQTGSTTVIRVGNPDRTVHGRQRYVMSYDVEGALNSFPDHEELYWNAIGDEWAVPIATATATVETPADVTKAACFAGPAGSSLPCASALPSGHTAVFRQLEMGPNQAFTVVAALPPGTVPAKPVLRERFSFARAFAATPVTVGALAALFALIAAGVAWLLWSRGRDRRFVGQVPGLAPAAGQQEVEQARPLLSRPDGAVEFVPPDGIRPGQVGTLIDEKADVLDVTATIVDLAVRKYLFIEELPRANWFSSRDWRLTRLDNSEPLLPYEKRLYDSLFSGEQAVLMSDLKKKFAPRMKAVQDQLYADAVHQGWFKGRPDTVRSRWTVAGWLLVGAGVGLTYLLAKPLHTHLALVGLGVVAGGVVLTMSARYMPARTGKGSAALARVLGFRQYIRTAEVDQLKFEERESIFSRYLPYAIVFGETDRWAKAFASLGQAAATGSAGGSGLYWYAGPGAWDLGHFGSSMNSFTSSAAGVLTSTPGGSGSSGFGGGGSAGGGGGGGGGGSW
jgi:hypothetical protein